MNGKTPAAAIQASGKDAGSGHNAQARTLEEQAFKDSESKELYEHSCRAILDSLHPSDESSRDLDIAQIEALDPDGPSLGDFTNLTLHKDGLYSSIHKARPNNPEASPSLVALKLTRPSLIPPPHSPTREAHILSLCSPHPNIIPLLSTFTSPSPTGGTLFVLTLPFLPYDLDTLLHHPPNSHPLPPSLISHILTSLFRALSHIHSLSIIHRDIKPSNLLLSGPLSLPSPSPSSLSVRLIDFGIAYLPPSSSSPSPPTLASEPPTLKLTDVGTTHYRPPELLFGSRAYGTELDLWAAGCVVAECVRPAPSHSPLFHGGAVGSELGLIKSVFETLGTPDGGVWPSAKSLPDWNKMSFTRYPRRGWKEILGPGVDAGARDLVARLVRFEGAERITTGEVS
ncbi:MAG: hypothetical protein Q9160_006251 [Pyrenula sp. 1 TL-2023]